MKVTCSSSDPTRAKVDLLAFGLFSGDAIPTEGPLAAVDQALDGALGRMVEREEYKAKPEHVLATETLGRLPCQRVAVIGLGDRAKANESTYRMLAARAARLACAAHLPSLAVGLPVVPGAAEARTVGEGFELGAYRFTKYFTGDRRPKVRLEQATLLVPSESRVTRQMRDALETGARVGQCICSARDLVNEPPNELTPLALAAFARQAAKSYGLSCEVWDRAKMKRAGMRLLLAVAQGSANEPCLIHLRYAPARASKRRLVVVGKGLTFDSGGLCIKPAAGMGDMKSDMAGAANVIGLMCAVAVTRPALEVHGIIGAAENMPDGNAYRPADVFTSMDGKTVEIVNTDAEGRLVLADVLAYARRLHPSALLCNATLTGACIVALGQRCSGYYATEDGLAEGFARAAREAGEQFWHMPLLEDLRDQLKSDIADVKHVGDRWGGSITAALFLKEFVGDTPFVHCDIAGPAFAEKPYGFYTKGGTAHGVLSFLRYAENMAREKTSR